MQGHHRHLRDRDPAQHHAVGLESHQRGSEQRGRGASASPQEDGEPEHESDAAERREGARRDTPDAGDRKADAAHRLEAGGDQEVGSRRAFEGSPALNEVSRVLDPAALVVEVSRPPVVVGIGVELDQATADGDRE